MKKQRVYGFSLTEIIVAMGILGIMGIFAISKLVIAQQDQQRKAIFKETIATVQGIFMDILSTGGTNNYTEENFLPRLNAIKTCHDSVASGCWNATTQGTNGESGQPGAILANGATIMGFDDNNTNPANGIIIDYNGQAGPNVIGQDQLHFVLCYTAPSCNGWFVDGSNNVGDIGPINWEVAANKTLWESLFQ